MNGVKSFFSKSITNEAKDKNERENEIRPCARMSEI